MSERRILVAHGCHPDELGMRRLYDRLQTIPGIKHRILNPWGWDQDPPQRKTEIGENLGVLRPDPQGTPGQRLLAEFLSEIRDYDLVFVPHGANDPDEDAVAYSPDASTLVRKVAGMFDTHRALIVPGLGPGQSPNALGLEVTPGTLNIESVVNVIGSLANGEAVPEAAMPMYEYQHIGGVKVEAGLRLNLPHRYPPFGSIIGEAAVGVCAALNIELNDEPPPELFAYGWDLEAHGHKGYFGEVYAKYPFQLL